MGQKIPSIKGGRDTPQACVNYLIDYPLETISKIVPQPESTNGIRCVAIRLLVCKARDFWWRHTLRQLISLVFVGCVACDKSLAFNRKSQGDAPYCIVEGTITKTVPQHYRRHGIRCVAIRISIYNLGFIAGDAP